MWTYQKQRAAEGAISQIHRLLISESRKISAYSRLLWKWGTIPESKEYRYYDARIIESKMRRLLLRDLEVFYRSEAVRLGFEAQDQYEKKGFSRKWLSDPIKGRILLTALDRVKEFIR